MDSMINWSVGPCFARDEFKLWCNGTVDFLDTRFNSFATVGVMHEITLLIVGSMKRFYDKKEIGLVLLQAIKFCAPWICLSTC